MGLAEKLTARAARQGRSAPVACGELGTVTVEALPVRELEMLLRQTDGQRAVFYAACRELQSAGEELRKAGKVFAPDGIMQFVSDSEAAAAARTVLELSGQADLNTVDRVVWETSENQNRLQIVQEKSNDEKAKTQVQTGSNRLASVQYVGADSPQEDEIRPGIVQEIKAPAPGFGQVSRETGDESAEFDTVSESDKKAQAMEILLSERTQDAVAGECIPMGAENAAEAPKETLWKTEVESGNRLHEIKPEFGETAHEATSELAEAVARRMVEGLRRAKWVRGD